MSFRNAAEQARAIESAAHERAKLDTVAHAYQKYPKLVQCDANSKMIVELVRDWAGPHVHPSPALFDSMIDENGEEALKMLAQQPIERTKEQLIEEILGLIASKNSGRDGKFDDFSLKNEEKRMASWSLDQLRARLNEIKTKQRMSSTMSVPALKAYVKEQHRNQRKYPGYPDLPQTIWQDGRSVRLDASGIKALSSYEIKRLTRIYGDQQVNDRLAQN
jgi:hypothetical protein